MATFTTEQILAEKTIKGRTMMIKSNIKEGTWEWVARALEVIHSRQTADEQNSGETQHNNSIGFNGLDAQILSSFATQVKKWKATPVDNRLHPVPLSPKQLIIARNKMAKYAGQLELVVRAKMRAADSQ